MFLSALRRPFGRTIYYMNELKKTVFFDGDGTLWYPKTTRRTRKPWWIYLDEAENIIQIVKNHRLQKEDALMVGDLYTWDYAPAEAAGIDAVLIDSTYHQERLAAEPATNLAKELDEILPQVRGALKEGR